MTSELDMEDRVHVLGRKRHQAMGWGDDRLHQGVDV